MNLTLNTQELKGQLVRQEQEESLVLQGLQDLKDPLAVQETRVLQAPWVLKGKSDRKERLVSQVLQDSPVFQENLEILAFRAELEKKATEDPLAKRDSLGLLELVVCALS